MWSVSLFGERWKFAIPLLSNLTNEPLAALLCRPSTRSSRRCEGWQGLNPRPAGPESWLVASAKDAVSRAHRVGRKLCIQVKKIKSRPRVIQARLGLERREGLWRH